ncbi:MAG: sodium-dependent transporter [Gemmatimonadota bacterium]
MAATPPPRARPVREAWGTRLGLILAMAGNAIGLGNFLRFPVQAATHGGGAFMIPYFLSLLLFGIPLMWVEWAIGRHGGVRGHRSTPGMFHALWAHPLARYAGALGILMPLVVMLYYTYVESWSLGYALFSLTGAFGETLSIDSMTAFLQGYQGATPGAGFFHNLALGPVIFPTVAYGFFLVTLAANLYFLHRGLSGGIEKVALYGMPVLFVFAIAVMIRVLTLGTPDPAQPGNNVLAGLGFIWNPDLSALGDATVWLAAAGQVFFTLSLGQGSLHCYASYLRPKDDLALSGLATAATNETAEVVLGSTIAIPAAVAFFGVAATTQLAGSGPFNLGFVTLPVVFDQIPGGALFGALWFFLLFIAGITSSLAMGQVVIAFLGDAFGVPRGRAVAWLGAAVFLGSQPVIFLLGSGYMGELDFWAGSFGLFLFGTIEMILFSWVFGIRRGWEEITQGADIRIPRIFRFLIGWVTPVLMIGILIGWLTQGAVDVVLMRDVDAAARSTVLAARGFLVATLVALLWMIRRAWRGRSQESVAGEVTA